MTLSEYITNFNAEVDAYMAENPGCFRGYMPDLAHYATKGIFTVAQFERWEMECTISDVAKEAYGTRSACPDIEGMSDEELKATYCSLLETAQEAWQAEEEMEAQACVEMENVIENLGVMGAADRETAVRWLREAEQDDHAAESDDYFCFLNGLPYGYFKEVA